MRIQYLLSVLMLAPVVSAADVMNMDMGSRLYDLDVLYSDDWSHLVNPPVESNPFVLVLDDAFSTEKDNVHDISVAGSHNFFAYQPPVKHFNAPAFHHGHVPAVPVPAAVWLFVSGAIGLLGVARRRKTN